MAARFPILYIAEPEAEAAVLSSGVLAYLVEAMPQATFTVVGSSVGENLAAQGAAELVLDHFLAPRASVLVMS